MQDGQTPLHWASDKGHLDVVKALVASGADVTAKDNVGAVWGIGWIDSVEGVGWVGVWLDG